MQISARQFVFTSICCWALATTNGAAAPKKGEASAQLYMLVNQAMQDKFHADDRLYEQMQLAANQLEAYYQSKHHFPEDGTESQIFLNDLEKDAPTNPFILDAALKKQMGENCPDKVTYELRSQLALSPQQRKENVNWLLKDCQGKPGKIGFMHNTETAFLMWGIGLDGKPITDRTTGDARVIFRNLRPE